MKMPSGLSQSSREMLRDALPGTINHLKARRADLIDENLIAAYVAIDWLEWNGGSLRLTTVGSNICRQLAQQDIVRDDAEIE